jgi:DNA replication and repair protein RecF
MSIKEIELVSFRNHVHSKFEFSAGINVIWGENGSGKTAILEAIHTLSIGRSFRTSKVTELLKKGETLLSVTGVFVTKNKEEKIQVNQTVKGERRFLINGQKADGLKQLIGKNPVVLLSPEEQIITKGSPGNRRNYFDKTFSVVSRPYLSDLIDYTKALKQRNRMLMMIRDKQSTEETLQAWDEKLSILGFELLKKRKALFMEFERLLAERVIQYGNQIEFTCSYENLNFKNEKEMQKKLVSNRKNDIFLGRTNTGPHREKFEFVFGTKQLREYGSQGEHKLALLLIKLAELEFFKKKLKITPTLLLDDLFAKLDDKRSRKILDMLNNAVQLIITMTDLKDIEKRGVDLNNEHNKSLHLKQAWLN